MCAQKPFFGGGGGVLIFHNFGLLSYSMPRVPPQKNDVVGDKFIGIKSGTGPKPKPNPISNPTSTPKWTHEN